MNHCLLDRYPYFFKYRYKDAKRSYTTYESNKMAECRRLFKKTIKQLQESPRKTPEQREWLKDYQYNAPLIMSNSPMNLVCKYIESIDFAVVSELKKRDYFDWEVYMDKDVTFLDKYQDVVECYKRFLKEQSMLLKEGINDENSPASAKLVRELMYIDHNVSVLTNCLVWYLFVDRPDGKKDLLWETFGAVMTEHAEKNADNSEGIFFPCPDDEGEIEYLGQHYALRKVEVVY